MDMNVPTRTLDFDHAKFPPLRNTLLLDSVQGRPLSRFPVWAMRQAGRYLEEFKASREGVPFFDFCHMPEKCCEVTLQPIRRFDFDASIIFSDIIVLPQVMGMEVELLPKVGPSFTTPLETEADLDGLVTELGDSLDKVYDAIFLTRHRLNGVVPLIGFTGGPWTLATYMIEGSSPGKCTKTKQWVFQRPDAFRRLIDMLAELIATHLANQITAGAQLVQVFESNLGELASEEFEEFILPALLRIAESVKQKHPSVPTAIFPRGCHFCFEALAKSKFDVISVDWTHQLKDVRARVGEQVTLQGNLEPCALYGPDELIRARTEKMLAQAGSTRHIANLGWGMLPDHDPEKLQVFVEAVHAFEIK